MADDNEHRAVSGADFMPSGWCGGCEVCDNFPCPDVCVVCSYDPRTGEPRRAVDWPCRPFLLAHCRLLEAERDKAKQQGRWDAAEAIEDAAPGDGLQAELWYDIAEIARGVSVPETP